MRAYFGSASGGANRTHAISASPMGTRMGSAMGSAKSAASESFGRWGKGGVGFPVDSFRGGAATSQPSSPTPIANPMPTITPALEIAETKFTLLRFPNPESLTILFFSVGMVKACTAVLAAEAEGSLADSSGSLAAATLVSNARTGLTLIILFMIVELLRLLHFYQLHAHNLWEDYSSSADDPSAQKSSTKSSCTSSSPLGQRPPGKDDSPQREREDPLLSAIAFMKLARRPAVRRLGYYRNSDESPL